jgi:hypothetical protein
LYFFEKPRQNIENTCLGKKAPLFSKARVIHADNGGQWGYYIVLIKGASFFKIILLIRMERISKELDKTTTLADFPP